MFLGVFKKLPTALLMEGVSLKRYIFGHKQVFKKHIGKITLMNWACLKFKMQIRGL